MRAFELRNISPFNDLSRLLYMIPLQRRDELFSELAKPEWKPNFQANTEAKQIHTQKLFEGLLKKYNSSTLKTDPLAHFLAY